MGPGAGPWLAFAWPCCDPLGLPLMLTVQLTNKFYLPKLSRDLPGLSSIFIHILDDLNG